MKRLFYFGILLFFTNTFGQIATEKIIDTKLVGVFKGTEVDGQVKGLTKNWIVTRSEKGTYVIMFTTISNCQVKSFVENGTWWIQDGKYYELFSESDEPSIYEYEIVAKGNIKFIVKNSDVAYDAKQNEFFDIKLN